MQSANQFKVGDAFSLPRFRQIWVVRQIVDRGLVVSTLEKDDHRHLLEWSDLTQAVKS